MVREPSEMAALGLLMGSTVVLAARAQEPAVPVSDAADRFLLLAPSPGNPRNSEGDLLRLQDGTLLFAWTRFESGRGSDHDPASVAIIRSDDDGATWNEPRALVRAPDGMNVMSVTLRHVDKEKLALFYLHKRSLRDCRPLVCFSEDQGMTWGDPVQIVDADDVGYDVLNNDRVLVDARGALIVPVARHAGVGVGDTFRPGARLRCYRSEDGGKTWQAGAWAPQSEGVVMQEPGLFEGADGTLHMFARTDAGTQYIMDSSDGGLTFSSPRPWTLRSPLSPATVERLACGDLLAIWNEPPVSKVARSAPRTPLVAARSSDDGASWGDRIVLFDHADGWYCYVALLVEDERMLLATCAGNRRTGNGLETTALLRCPLPDAPGLGGSSR